MLGNNEQFGPQKTNLDKDSRGQTKLEDFGGWLLPAVEGHILEQSRTE